MSSRSDITDLIDAVAAPEAAFDFEAVFRAHYPRIARVIARVVRNDARSEELAVEVFLKLWRSPRARGQGRRLALPRCRPEGSRRPSATGSPRTL